MAIKKSNCVASMPSTSTKVVEEKVSLCSHKTPINNNKPVSQKCNKLNTMNGKQNKASTKSIKAIMKKPAVKESSINTQNIGSENDFTSINNNKPVTLESNKLNTINGKQHKPNSKTIQVITNKPVVKESSVKLQNSGSEHDFLRLFEQGKINVQGKSLQHVRTRKKKFTSLKKKVLEERLRKWKASQELISESCSTELDTKTESLTVCIHGFCEHDELIDDDEYEEILENLKEMASKVGNVTNVLIVRPMDGDTNGSSFIPAFVRFQTSYDAAAAAKCWNGLILGGQELKCTLMTFEANSYTSSVVLNESMLVSDIAWRDWCVEMERKRQSRMLVVDADENVDVFISNVITDDDLEDEECLDETMRDVKELTSKFGEVCSTRLQGRNIVVTYRGGLLVAKMAVSSLRTTILSGSPISASVGEPSTCRNTESDESLNSYAVELRNVLTPDDFADNECMQESINDIRELAQQYGTVTNVTIVNETNTENNDSPGCFLRVVYSSSTDAELGVAGFNGMVIGGQTISAQYPKSTQSNGSNSELIDSKKSDQSTSPLYSGDKVIPERFAECKRVPKIPNNEAPRQYASQINDESVKPLLIEMLSELMRLQRRAIEENNKKARRRIVMGLREVARGIRSHKVKLIVMANNLDEYGAIDEKCQEIISLAHDNDVPIFYEFSKRTLGKALGKTIKIGIVGIQNADGANQQFKKLLKLASDMPIKPAATKSANT